jgi:acyl-CoA synthetase (AMP-forming)/AMP-acid ligase II
VLIERLRDELDVETILTAYGLTEATGTVTMCRQGDDPETIATTSGRAIPDTEVRVVDEKGAEVATGEPGEVVVRGYNVMQGYYEDDEATAAAIDPDGWLHTGDIGVMDDRGNLRITDRLKDMYVVGGFNAYPAEVEQILARYEGIAECAVVGVADERLGEVGCAFVVQQPGADVDPDAVIAWARERMANFKVPRTVLVVDELPRNASGKVLKFELRELLADA